MPNFFERRNALELARDLAIGAVGGAKNGVIGSLILSAGAGTTFAVGSLTAVATACALGGAIAIIPALWMHQTFLEEPANAPFLMRVTTSLSFRAAVAFSSACIGAAIFGLAMIPTGLTALTASLTLGLFSALANAIVMMTSNPPTAEDFRSMHIA